VGQRPLDDFEAIGVACRKIGQILGAVLGKCGFQQKYSRWRACGYHAVLRRGRQKLTVQISIEMDEGSDESE
jgi:hypothetical protein